MPTSIPLSQRLKNIQPSPTLAVTAKAKKLKAEGKDIVNLAAGEPDFDTPDFIKEAARLALDQGFTKYTPSTGIPELKELISEKFRKDNGLEYRPAQIVVSCGAKHSIYNTLFVLVSPGDEVLIPKPYWVSYPQMVHLCQGIPRFIETSADNSFKITPAALEEQITPKTKVLILNSPSNPSACVYTQEELKEIAGICVRRKIFVVSDEIYEKLVYDGLKHVSIAGEGAGIEEYAVTVNGVSKSYSMTGWRIGYLGAPEEIAKAIGKVQDHSTSNPNSIAQKAACAALRADESFQVKVREEFQRRRDYVAGRLKSIDAIDCTEPRGAFYLFCGIAKTGMDSTSFASRLLDDTYVSLIPGIGFGVDTCVRMSFATSMERLEKGMDRLSDWIAKL
ncbi:MAG: pyridoxal phosphate-dependent aminotransferase [Candidatus Omnitrophica bacterium]|nr:pyridoxal phosphate-dependent aminotransferase [Candidatus Omnitrophota bacterium]